MLNRVAIYPVTTVPFRCSFLTDGEARRQATKERALFLLIDGSARTQVTEERALYPRLRGWIGVIYWAAIAVSSAYLLRSGGVAFYATTARPSVSLFTLHGFLWCANMNALPCEINNQPTRVVNMANQTWAVLFTDKAGESHEIKFGWHEQPSFEEAAARIVRQHQDGQQTPVIIDISRTDPTPKQTQMAYFGYKISGIKLVEDIAG